MAQTISRRDAIKLAASGLAASLIFDSTPASADADDAPRTALGIVTYALGRTRQAMRRGDATRDLFEPMAFLEYCHGLGAGGVQMSLGVRDEAYCAKLREKAASYRMFIEANVGPPRGADELDQFDAELRTAKACGTGIARTVIMPGRRYEQFSSLDEFKQFAQRGQRALELAEPVAAKHRVRLAVENHKDQRLDERVALFKHLDSEWIGACVDVGNSIALLEDPVDTAKAFAPWAVCVHLKDQAVREYEDGFLLADIPLGEGFIDLKQVVAVLRAAKPGIAFSLEMITRDPLKVPCLTQKYWATMPDVPGADLAAMLRAVRARPAKELAAISNLPVERQAAVELEGVRASLRYARGALGI